MASADKNPVCRSRDTRNGSLLNRKAPTAKLVKQVAHNTTTRCGRVMYTLPGMSAVKMPNHWTHTRESTNLNALHTITATYHMVTLEAEFDLPPQERRVVLCRVDRLVVAKLSDLQRGAGSTNRKRTSQSTVNG